MKRLPVKSLIQFRSVSKSWKSLIDSSQFIAAYNLRHTQPQHMFVWYKDLRGKDQYVSFVDDDSFPQHRFVANFPRSLGNPRIVGSSYGLLCFDCSPWRLESSTKAMVVLWNPSIRKSISIDVPDMLYAGHDIVLGFGVCPVTFDPKIIHITQFRPWKNKKSQTGNFWKVKVYELSSGKCKSLSSNLPSILILVSRHQVVIDMFIYWCGVEYASVGSVSPIRDQIMSFDMIDESFKVVELPDSIAGLPPTKFSISISKLRGALVMIVCNGDKFDSTNEETFSCSVWMMEHGEERSFTKLYTIMAPGDSIVVVGFRKGGGPIMDVEDYTFNKTELVVYEPSPEVNNHLLSGSSYNVNSYIETLLLLDRSDCSSY